MLHGGDIYHNKVTWDFSVNINPLGVPETVKNALMEAIEHSSEYPDLNAEKLTRNLSRMSGVAQERIQFGNGASELFFAIVHAIKPGKTLIPVPSFFGYEKAAMAACGEIIFYPMKQEHGFCLDEEFSTVLTKEVDLVFLANPNNPVGNLISPSLLERLALHCKDHQIILVLDECFLEFTQNEQEYSFKGKLEQYPNVVVVRAFTKIFAIPGVRLGYLFCSDQELKKRIATHLPEWNLSVFAQMAGAAACQETGYLKESIEIVQREREFLTWALEEMGIRVFPSTADFLLITTNLPLYDGLLAKEILLRDCSNFRGLGAGYYRIAVKNHRENRILIKAIREWKEIMDASDRICTSGGN